MGFNSGFKGLILFRKIIVVYFNDHWKHVRSVFDHNGLQGFFMLMQILHAIIHYLKLNIKWIKLIFKKKLTWLLMLYWRGS